MSPSDKTHRQRQDDELLGALLDASREPAPSEFEVARLRRRVSEAIRVETHTPTRVSVMRAAAVACTVLVSIGGLHLTTIGSRQVEGIDQASPVSVARLAEGGIELRIAGAQRVVRSDRPDGEEGVPVTRRAEGVFVDEDADLEPGSMVFYRVD